MMFELLFDFSSLSFNLVNVCGLLLSQSMFP